MEKLRREDEDWADARFVKCVLLQLEDLSSVLRPVLKAEQNMQNMPVIPVLRRQKPLGPWALLTAGLPKLGSSRFSENLWHGDTHLESQHGTAWGAAISL